VIRVGVADEHALARSGLIDLLRSADGLAVVGEATDGQGACKIARDEDPDIMVVDLRMSDLDGFEVTRQIAARQPSVAVVLLAQREDAHEVSRAVEMGAKAYVLRTTPGQEVLETLRMVAQGHVVLDAGASQAFAERSPAVATDIPRLSTRELEVLHLLSGGLTNRQIAERLSLSRETVKTHVERVFRRLGAADRTEAVSLGFRTGLLD
jgi:two-component system NarL family response regulator